MTARQAAGAQHAEYLAGLQRMMVLAAPEAAALQSVDWVAIATENPAEAVRLGAQKESLKSRLNAINQEFQQGQEQLSKYQEQQLAELVAKEHKALIEKNPDFSDPVKAISSARIWEPICRMLAGLRPRDQQSLRSPARYAGGQGNAL
jgi:hypothetical protein